MASTPSAQISTSPPPRPALSAHPLRHTAPPTPAWCADPYRPPSRRTKIRLYVPSKSSDPSPAHRHAHHSAASLSVHFPPSRAAGSLAVGHTISLEPCSTFRCDSLPRPSTARE